MRKQFITAVIQLLPAPPYYSPPDVPLATVHNQPSWIAAVPYLLDDPLCQSLELPCRALVPTTTVKLLIHGVTSVHNNTAEEHEVHCIACKQDVKSEGYHTHDCSTCQQRAR